MYDGGDLYSVSIPRPCDLVARHADGDGRIMSRVYRIGQIVPSSNVTMETEIPAIFRMRESLYPERFTFHSSRMRMKKVTQDELAAMDADSDRCALELSDAAVDVMGYACLVAIMAMGLGYHRESQTRLAGVAEANGRACPVVSSAGALIHGLGSLGAKKIALITGIMAIGRYFAGPLVHSLNPVGVLVVSALLSTLGLFLLSQFSGAMVYVAAVVFALGVTYFWPTMLGCVAEYLPKTGALGLSLVGGAGMAGVAIFNPIIGAWADEAKQNAISNGISGTELTIASSQAILSNLLVFPILLIFMFSGLYLYRRKSVRQS